MHQALADVERRVVGTKQLLRALDEGKIAQAFVAADADLLLTKRVNLAMRIVPGGNHSEASWEKQVPIFMECLGL